MDINQITQEWYESLLALPVEDPMVGEFTNYTEDGITYIHVYDTSVDYELVNGQWLEKAPF